MIGGRSKLGHSASEVGPGEYTAEHGLVPAGPTAKMLGRLGHREMGPSTYGFDAVDWLCFVSKVKKTRRMP